MKKTIIDGWHTIAGHKVYIERGYIKRGLSSDGTRTTYPYSAGRYCGWDYDPWMTPGNFRRKVKNGSATMR